MSENGADIIEIGIPFSDPIAEGVVIQEVDTARSALQSCAYWLSYFFLRLSASSTRYPCAISSVLSLSHALLALIHI